jgi:hypothetical protein
VRETPFTEQMTLLRDAPPPISLGAAGAHAVAIEGRVLVIRVIGVIGVMCRDRVAVCREHGPENAHADGALASRVLAAVTDACS